jgi:hypothetical protein
MIRGEATANLSDGRKLTLTMGFRPLAKASAELLIPASGIFGILKRDDGRQTLVVLTLIEHALAKYHRDIDSDDIDELMRTDSHVLTEALGEAISGAFGDEEEKEEVGNVPNGTGTRSKKTGQKRG